MLATMGIRIKITMGFVLLTVVIISSVSFWAAQSLGLSIDSSDYEKLVSLKNQLTALLKLEQTSLDRTADELATTFRNLDMLNKPPAEQQRISESIKSSMNIDWLDIFVNEAPLLSGSLPRPRRSPGAICRLSRSGPYSYQGYILSESEIASNTRLFIARRPDLSRSAVPMFCFFDAFGIFDQREFSQDLQFLQKLMGENLSGEIRSGGEIYRVRAFNLSNEMKLLTGYPAQRTIISRLDIDNLMIRLTVLQVIGLLILGYFLGRRLFLPLQALGRGIEKVAQGDWKEIPLDQPPMVNSGVEIESVARSFNRMVKELSLAQNRLIEVQKELAKKDKLAALGRFSAGIAHEINNPLGTILANAGLLKEAVKKGQEVSAEEIEEIIAEVKRCKNIISTLRTYTSKARPNLTTMNFTDAVKSLFEFVRQNTEFSPVEIELNIDGDGQIGIDLEAMQQVFYNLTRNAAEAMHDLKNAHLAISARALSDHCEISFIDCGTGFECEPELVFEPLFTTKPQGTGLGLIICQAIIEGHSGKISASRKNGATEFLIMMPLIQQNSNFGEQNNA
ncbi:MAG: HAMP domain-containing sensor histidine kinase [Candidatus Riflebacteria bacterium]